ncbi:MAG: S8 family serine peptidase [Gemmatimonadetes bacterium]|nr:S8 family serine peptidase [Gemmatimonadota bacterium]
MSVSLVARAFARSSQRRRPTLSLGIVFLLGLSACGGDPAGPPVAATVTVSGPSAPLTSIGETVTLTATAKTSKGATISGAEMAWSSANPSVATVAGGVVTAVGNGTASISATSGTAVGSFQVTVQQTVTQVAVTFASDTIRALTDTVRATATPRDARGNAVAGRTVTWSSLNPAVATVNGAGVVTAVAEGSAAIRASSDAAQGERSVVVRQRGAQLVFLRQPGDGRAGVTLPNQPQVEIQDARGNRVTTDNTTIVTATLGTGAGTVVSGATANALGGVVNFTGLTIGGTVGQKTITASAPGLTAATSQPLALSAGNPTQLVVASQNPQTVLAGDQLAQPLAAGVRDAFGNGVHSVAVQFSVPTNAGTLGNTLVVTDNNGNAATTFTTSRFAGTATVTASSPGLNPGSVQFTIIGAPNGRISGVVSLGALFPTVRTSAAAAAAAAKGPTHRTRSAPVVVPDVGGRVVGKSAVRAASAARSSASAPAAPDHVPGELLVTYAADGVNAPASVSAYRQVGAMAALRTTIANAIAPLENARLVSVADISPALLTARVKVAPGVTEAEAMAALRRDPRVRSVERNGIIRLSRIERGGIGRAWSVAMHRVGDLRALVPDPFGKPYATPASAMAALSSFPGSGNFPGTSRYVEQSWHYNMMSLPRAWQMTTGSSNVLVSVIDDGIRFDHPSMIGVLTNDGYDFVSANSVRLCSGGNIDAGSDGNGYDPDPTNPADRDYNEALDCYGAFKTSGNHGLHVAATIGAARGAPGGLVGVNWQLRIRPIRALGLGGGTTFDVAQAVLYAAGLQASNGQGGFISTTPSRIINMSLGGNFPSTVGQAAVQSAQLAGALIIAAAGNDGQPTSGYPAGYPGVISVASVGPTYRSPNYSNYGSTITIAAPGGDVGSAFGLPGGVLSATWNFQTQQASSDFWQGTSMATPHVAGVAALLLAREPGLSASELRSRLVDYAIPIRDQADPNNNLFFFGRGLLSGRNALTATSAPPRRLQVRLWNRVTGVMTTIQGGSDGSFRFTGLSDGTYLVMGATDEDLDGRYGAPMRAFGAFGRVVNPTVITVNGAGEYNASFALLGAAELEANNTPTDADVLWVDGYITGEISSQSDLDFSVIPVTQAGTYTLEVTGQNGACGFGVELDPVLTLLDGNNTLITSLDDNDGNNRDYCARITRQLTPGLYSVRIEGAAVANNRKSQGRYVVSVRRQ